MSDFQSYVIVGNLTDDPVMKYVGETQKTTFSVACNQKRGQKERTLFMDVECWGKLAEMVAEYMRKGRKVVVQGEIVEDRWDDRETGEKRKKIFVNANSVTFIGARPESENEERPARRNAEPIQRKEYDDLPF